MIGCNIENRAHVRRKARNGFQLKAADFRNCDRFWGTVQHFLRVRVSNVPHYKGVWIVRFQNLTHERRRRRFAVRSRNPDDAAPLHLICELDLTDDRYFFLS